MASENKLLALAFRALKELRFEVLFWKGCGHYQHLASTFGIVAKFPRRKSGSILPYFLCGISAAFRFKCVIVHKTLFSPSFCGENTATKVPHFHGKNSTKFCVWCAMAHQQGFSPVYMARISMFILMQAVAHQSVKHVDACHIHGETNVTSWHGSRQSYREDHAHNIAWICTYSSCL